MVGRSYRGHGVEFEFGLDSQCSERALILYRENPGLLIDNAQRANEPATRPAQGAPRVEPDVRVPDNQRVGAEPRILKRVGDDEQVLALDGHVTEGVVSIHAPSQRADERPQKLLVLGDQGDTGGRDTESVLSAPDYPVKPRLIAGLQEP